MYPFATEFIVSEPKSRAAFIAEVMAWLKGNQNSKIFDESEKVEFNRDYVHLTNSLGEELRFRDFASLDGPHAIGFRHDLPDAEGRIWRTECVLRNGPADDYPCVIRIKTQCLPTGPNTKLDTPKKPYLIKSLLKSGWGGTDGYFRVTDQPIWLSEVEGDLERAVRISIGSDFSMPTVYFSSRGTNSWLMDRSEIERLAYELGGIAHVVVEPSRLFSHRLREKTNERNAYNGTVGIAIPQLGVFRRFFIGSQIVSAKELYSVVKTAAISIRAQMPAAGWEWTDLQEQALRSIRIQSRNALTAEEVEQLYQEEISNLSEKIKELETLQSERSSTGFPEQFPSGDPLLDLVQSIGPEVYRGEIKDRILFAVKETLESASRIGLDKRSVAVFSKIAKQYDRSDELDLLLAEIRRATIDHKKLAAACSTLLKQRGYTEKSGGKHIVFEPLPEFEGLEQLTLAKTPSDHRAAANTKSQIENSLGLTKLKK